MPANQVQLALSRHPGFLAYMGSPEYLASFPWAKTQQDLFYAGIWRWAWGLMGHDPDENAIAVYVNLASAFPDESMYIAESFGMPYYQAKRTSPEQDISALSRALAGVNPTADQLQEVMAYLAPYLPKPAPTPKPTTPPVTPSPAPTPKPEHVHIAGYAEIEEGQPLAPGYWIAATGEGGWLVVVDPSGNYLSWNIGAGLWRYLPPPPPGYSQGLVFQPQPAGSTLLLSDADGWWLLAMADGRQFYYNVWHGWYREVAAAPPGYEPHVPFLPAGFSVQQFDPASQWGVVQDPTGNTFTWNAWYGWLRDVAEVQVGGLTHQGLPWATPDTEGVVILDDPVSGWRATWGLDGLVYLAQASTGQYIEGLAPMPSPFAAAPESEEQRAYLNDTAARLTEYFQNRNTLRQQAAVQAEQATWTEIMQASGMTRRELIDFMVRHGIPSALYLKPSATPGGGAGIPLHHLRQWFNEWRPGAGDAMYPPLPPPPPNRPESPERGRPLADTAPTRYQQWLSSLTPEQQQRIAAGLDPVNVEGAGFHRGPITQQQIDAFHRQFEPGATGPIRNAVDFPSGEIRIVSNFNPDPMVQGGGLPPVAPVVTVPGGPVLGPGQTSPTPTPVVTVSVPPAPGIPPSSGGGGGGGWEPDITITITWPGGGGDEGLEVEEEE